MTRGLNSILPNIRRHADQADNLQADTIAPNSRGFRWRLNVKKEYDFSIGIPRVRAATLLLLLLTFSCGRTSAPPNPSFTGCEATVEASPEIRGLRLRMTTDEVKNKFPANQILEDRDGRAYLTISKKEKTNINSGFDLNGLSEAFITFLDGRISEFRLTYENTGLQSKEELFPHFVYYESASF